MMNYNPNTIYKDLMKRVHPDLHPTMPNATAKAQMVNQYKTNSHELKRLAVMWGFLVEPTMNTYRPRQEAPKMLWVRVSETPVAPETLYDLGLRPGANYVNPTVYFEIYWKANKLRRVARLVRTTKKCVVVDIGNGVTKTIRMANIYKIDKYALKTVKKNS